MSFTDEQTTYVMDYFSNCFDESRDQTMWDAGTPLYLEILEELRSDVDWLNPELDDEALEIKIRAELRELSFNELEANAREIFGVWVNHGLTTLRPNGDGTYTLE